MLFQLLVLNQHKETAMVRQSIFVLTAALSLDACATPKQNQVSMALASSGQCTPSSAIPDRRSFPVNPTLNPCDNFYQYACSEALSCFKLREDRNRHIFAFSDSSERLLDKKKQFLKDLSSKRKDLTGWSQSLANVYSACMNEESGKSEELSFVKEKIKTVESLNTREELLHFFAEENLASKVALIDYQSTPNLENSDISDVILDPTPRLMNLPERSYYYNQQLMSDYTKLVQKFFTTLGLRNARNRAKAIVAFEKGLAEAYPLPQEMRKLYVEKRYISRDKLISEHPSLLLSTVLQNIPHNIVFRDVVPASLKYVDNKFARLNVQTLKDLYLYNVLSPEMDNAYPQYFAKKFEFKKTYLGGPAKRPVRDERCAMYVMNSYAKELDHEVIEVLYPNFPSQTFENLVEKIRVAMVDRVSKNTWLSEKGREGALKKLRAVKMRIVKPKNEKEWDLQKNGSYRDDAKIANSYEQNRLLREKMIEDLSHKRNKDAWEMNPLLVNAYYDPSSNTFNMPMGILQYPFFDESLKEYENLGSVGVVVGHEIGHAFDDNGAKFNENGVLEDWMTPEDIATFARLGSVLIAQYDAVGHNGKLTLGENIADTTGLNFAYGAAFPNNEGSKEEKQDFFLQYARDWCGVMTPSEYEHRVKTDPHAQTEVRVNVPIKNQDGFYEAFSCKEGDKMYLPREQRLRMW